MPYDAPAAINDVADGYEKRVLRYPVQAKTPVRDELKYLSSNRFLRDGLFMAVKILGIMRETGYSFPKLLSQIPEFFCKTQNRQLFLRSRGYLQSFPK